MALFGFLSRTTYSSQPGGLEISHQKLKVLRPDLYRTEGSRRWLPNFFNSNSDIHSFEEHLKDGDARAAVVVMLEPLLVAAYTDELDCVALLEFPDSFVKEYGLEDGTRLLTVNQYRKEDRVDDDLIPGPADTKRWTGFAPIIADFVTDEVALIEAHKRSIDESEWQRAWVMGKEYVQLRPAVARNGSPGRSYYSETPPKVRWLVISLLMCIAGILVERWTVGEFLAKRAIESWPVTRGIVKKSEVQPNSIGTYHTALIEYEYVVAEKPYSSTSVQVGGTTFQSVNNATEITKQFPVKSEVPVYYNSKQPFESFLRAGVDWTDYVVIISPVIYALMWGMLFCVLFEWRWRFKRTRRNRLDRIFGKDQAAES